MSIAETTPETSPDRAAPSAIESRLQALEDAANSWAALVGVDVREMIDELGQIHAGTSNWAAAVGEDIRTLTAELRALRARVDELEAR